MLRWNINKPTWNSQTTTSQPRAQVLRHKRRCHTKRSPPSSTPRWAGCPNPWRTSTVSRRQSLSGWPSSIPSWPSQDARRWKKNVICWQHICQATPSRGYDYNRRPPKTRIQPSGRASWTVSAPARRPFSPENRLSRAWSSAQDSRIWNSCKPCKKRLTVRKSPTTTSYRSPSQAHNRPWNPIWPAAKRRQSMSLGSYQPSSPAWNQRTPSTRPSWRPWWPSWTYKDTTRAQRLPAPPPPVERNRHQPRKSGSHSVTAKSAGAASGSVPVAPAGSVPCPDHIHAPQAGIAIAADASMDERTRKAMNRQRIGCAVSVVLVAVGGRNAQHLGRCAPVVTGCITLQKCAGPVLTRKKNETLRLSPSLNMRAGRL